jgi:soluble lytic murein transglycosylase
MARRRQSKVTRIGHWLALGLVLAAVGSAGFVYVRWMVRERRYNQLIEEIAPRHGVDKFLVKAVMRQESGLDPFARSRTGAIGLMQIMPSTGRSIGYQERQLWNERTNIEAGTWLLAHALAFWRTQPVDNPLPFVLAEYNAGRGTVLRWAPMGQPVTAEQFLQTLPNAGVRHYIKRVSGYYQDYRDSGSL